MIRSALPSDAAAVAAVQAAAFGDEGPLIVRLIGALEAHACGRDRLSFVAESDEEVVGHVLVTRNRLDAPRTLVDVAVLSPLGVHPDRQGRGVGAALVARCVTEAAAAGFPAILLEGDPGYYSRLGFVAAGPLGFRKPSLRIPDAAFQVVVLPAYEEWMTGTLVYAEPFWDLDCVGLR